MPVEINKIDLSAKATRKRNAEPNQITIFQRKYQKDTPSDALRFDSKSGKKLHYIAEGWSARIKLPDGTKSKTITKSLKTKDRDEAIEKAMKLYRELIGSYRDNEIVKDEIKSRNTVDKIRPFGVCEIEGTRSKTGTIVHCNPEIKVLLDENANLNAAFLYAVFPSIERPITIDSSPLDSLILNGNLERGKIGITGTNNKESASPLAKYYSPSIVQLKNRLEKYKVAVSCKDWPNMKDREFEWMDGICAPNEKWYVALFYIPVRTDLDRMMRYSDIHMIEQTIVNAWAARHHKFPMGNYGERADSSKNPNRRLKPSGSGNDRSNEIAPNEPIPDNEEVVRVKPKRGRASKDFDPKRGYRWVYDKKVKKSYIDGHTTVSH